MPGPVATVAIVPELKQISQDLSALRAHLTSLQKEGQLLDQWCHVGYVLDFLLFRIYLFIITCYALVIICMWCVWINQWRAGNGVCVYEGKDGGSVTFLLTATILIKIGNHHQLCKPVVLALYMYYSWHIAHSYCTIYSFSSPLLFESCVVCVSPLLLLLLLDFSEPTAPEVTD